MSEQSHCLLVVDDEPAIRSMLSTVLHRAGFSVLLAANGEEAIELYRQHLGKISAVLLDVMLPPPDGRETLATLRQLDPNVRCCFMSGNTGDYSVAQLQALRPAHVFEKPFQSLRDLVIKLWEIVDVKTC